ncbi:MAG: hypothetical protein WCA08_05455 [Desulfoferrobacter sp.]
MRKYRRSIVLLFGVALIFTIFGAVTPSSAWQQVEIPYAYVGDGWDTVIIISNISETAITPYLLVANFNDETNFACLILDELGVGEIYSSTFGAISWCPGGSPPIPGIFQVYVGADLNVSAKPFGVAVAINNASFGGFGFQQYKSEGTNASNIFFGCATCAE